MTKQHSILVTLLAITLLLAACSTATESDADMDGAENNEQVEEHIMAKINGSMISEEDIEFNELLNQLHVELRRAEELAVADESSKEEVMAYWDKQSQDAENINLSLTSIIRTEAMAQLAEEKGLTVDEEEVMDQVERFLEQYEAEESVIALIDDYGREGFESQLKEYTDRWLLSMKVYNDVEEEVREDNPDQIEQEIRYLTEQKYEELLVSQMDTVEVDILIE
ncbi:hypothetical protein [Desertibacillus haloalkaliphilus]|uniref:hypothetical protein n=1 Tax=Desertibacillus haloalkaliphilus TaxID=1328930 RepID=UPI001C262662|nr:hypothetical protein [Desertibacillus haloalkaliphilus]MBU8908329.1 hypothetical protein [Desertibacillus haloalkaliphilus]